MKKIKLFTHTDFDGVGCAILAKLAFKNPDIEYCDYNNINQKIKDFIQYQQYQHFDYVYITDISVDEEVAKLINNTHPDNFEEGFNLGEMFCLLDHHKTAEWLNKYHWAFVAECNKYGNKNSGTSMFRDELVVDNYFFGRDSVCDFVEMVRRYDTYEWSTKYDDINPKNWNDLLYLYGRQKFVEKVSLQLNAGSFRYSDMDLLLLELNQEKIDKYINEKQKQIIQKEILGDEAGIVFAEQYHSELGNKLATNNAHLDFIVIIDMSKSVSYRGIYEDIDLGELAKVYGGGGHPRAAGSPIKDDVRQELINLIFN